MGWFSSACSAIGSAVSSVGRGIASAASAAWNTAKSAARKAVDWMADEAENFVGKVKDIWATVRPHVIKFAPMVSNAIRLIPHPWAQAAASAIEAGLAGLLALENSPILKKVEQAIIWASNAAKHFRDMYMTPKDVKEAEQRQQDLQEAMDAMKTEEQRQSIRFAAVINDYVLVQTHIQEILEKDTIKDFSHYLRLRATQKLLRAAEKTLNTARTLDEITADDSFLLRVGADLLAENPNLNDADAEKLDSIIKRRFNGKSLVPFVFEELICAWETKLQNMEAKWSQMNKEAATLKRQIKELEVKMQIESLTSNEEVQLVDLKNDAKNTAYQLNQQAEENRAMQSYVHAAEGFLQVLEKTAEQFEEEGRDYIVDDVATVGRLLVECAQYGKQWNDLTLDEQSLITDYANIFAEDSKKRTQELVEAEV
ncbi:hypothetical protein [Acinetobacter radioresistens]|uniref:hypothetical protein n=1 Tax=Acinetobacter radioresistens TaxID=40216 RepID=UPI000C321965|nr:hypothetical protein [Acinetobacter radioresistens]MCM1934660.1 hypothetical protein [Acinetobacter radioresistens]MCM1952053.1 hypothetical protein [Acinetobacter radioresistens]MCU4309850.1 hypothetical protein [Acinetobacter radioresistens]MCU4568412.1 hypothetical protein [Acinetobacter radioresistens]PKH29882.1 hypothetical protein BJF94_11480 [Acinetobacter radioresistens]